jgi:hypothetical protein
MAKVPINFIRRLDVPYGYGWRDFQSTTEVKSVINDAVIAKCDCVLLRRQNGMIKNYLANVGSDYAQIAMDEAHLKGLKFGLILEATRDDNSNRYTDSTLTSSIQSSWLNLFSAVMMRYPALDLIELEEPHFGDPTPSDGGLARRTLLTNYFVQMRQQVNQYHPNLLFGFNAARYGNLRGVGIDASYLNTNDIFDYFAPENAYEILGTPTQTNTYRWYEENYVPAFFGNMPLAPWTYTRYWPVGTNGVSNPGFFEEVKYMTGLGKPIGIFWSGDLNNPASYWPADTTLGTDGKTKLGNIPTNVSICSAPSFSYIVQEI